ncbi:unnamed protein product [Lampetra fluviatilis]
MSMMQVMAVMLVLLLLPFEWMMMMVVVMMVMVCGWEGGMMGLVRLSLPTTPTRRKVPGHAAALTGVGLAARVRAANLFKRIATAMNPASSSASHAAEAASPRRSQERRWLQLRPVYFAR